jgi:L-malate glycosyltransferase
MKVLHLNAGNETGGGMHHILLLLESLNRDEFCLGVFEEGELSRRARELGIHTVLFEQSSQFDMSITKKIAQYISENQIDIVHTHGPRANLFGAFIKRKTSFTWITTIHSDPRDDFMGQGMKGKIFTYLNLWAIKKADHYFAISDRFKEILVEFGISANQITTIVNGIKFDLNPSKHYNRIDFNLNDDDLLVIMVARLEKVKDHTTALEALKKAATQNPSIKLILVGEGTEKQEISRLIKSLKLSEHVLLLGHREDVTELYPLADVSLLTSKSESFPLVLLEAARAKVPAITTNVGGVRKMVPSEEYGWIAEVKDADQISTYLLRASRLKREGKLSTIGQEFHQHCSDRFSIENQAKDIYDTYTSLIRSH